MSSSIATRFFKPTVTTKPVRTFEGHTKIVCSVAFSPDGQYALTGSGDKTAQLWNVNNGTVVCTLRGYATSVFYSVAFSPNGQYALTGSFDKTAQLWNVKDGTVIHAFQGHTHLVTSVAFSPNGQSILTGSNDNTAKLWNVNSAAPVRTFRGHTSSVNSVAFSPNGQYILTGSHDRTAKLWNVNDGIVVHTFEGHTSFVSSVAFSPNGHYVLTGSHDRTAKLWNVHNGTVLTFQHHTNFVNSVAFSPNGQYALTGSGDKTATLWNVNDGRAVHIFQGHAGWVNSVAFSPNGQYALTGSLDKTIKLWQLPESVAASTNYPERVSVSSSTNVVANPHQTNQTITIHSDPSSDSLLNNNNVTGTADSTSKSLYNPEHNSIKLPNMSEHDSVDVSGTEGKLKHLTSMGFDDTLARTALESCDLNLERAVEFLLVYVSADNNSGVLMEKHDPSGINSDNAFQASTSSAETHHATSGNFPEYKSMNLALLNIRHQQGDHFLDIINNAAKVESGIYLLSQYPEELQSLLSEKSQSNLEEKELKAIMRSREHYQFYAHLVCKLNGMMKACETINSGMVSQADMSFQDYVHGLMREGACATLQQMDLGKALAGVIQWAKKQFASVPFTDAIGSFFQIACEFKSKRDQHLAIGRVAIMSALADTQEYDRGGINGTVHWIGRYIMRAQANQLALFELENFGHMKKLWTKAMGESANTPAKEQGCNVADLVIAAIMNPTKNTDLHNILEGRTLNHSASLSEIIVAAALNMPIKDVQNLDYFSDQEDNVGDVENSASNIPTQQYSNVVGSSNGSGVVSVVDTNASEQSNNSSNADVASKEEFHTMKKEVEMLRKEVAKLRKGKNETEVDSGGGLAQAYVNPHENGDQEISATKRIDYVEKRLAAMQSNLLEANKTIIELDERLEYVKNNNRKKSTTNEDHTSVLRRAKDKQILAKEEEKRNRAELFNEK